ncbi:hypothetical protein [Candidatus Uabimicrobium sp. HlEnr_7]|uniref:hypothetical protein n=1 Tax=Candidatus Uabimicrobium helgolandensis TaxID=3095367 RepID=UPI0035585B70
MTPSHNRKSDKGNPLPKINAPAFDPTPILFIATLCAFVISGLQGWLQYKFFGPYKSDSWREMMWLGGICSAFILILYYCSRVGHRYLVKDSQEYEQIYHSQRSHQKLLDILMIVIIAVSWLVQ